MATPTKWAVKEAVYNLLRAKLTLVEDVAEEYFEGTGFIYPCVRYSIHCTPDDCSGLVVTITVTAWDESFSSKGVVQILDELIQKLPSYWAFGSVRLQGLRVQGVPKETRQSRLWTSSLEISCLATN